MSARPMPPAKRGLRLKRPKRPMRPMRPMIKNVDLALRVPAYRFAKREAEAGGRACVVSAQSQQPP